MQNPLRTHGTRSLVVVIVGALALAIVAGTALTHATVPTVGMWNGGHMVSWSMGGWGTMLLGLLWMALILGLPIYVAYRLVIPSQSTGHTEDSALTILREQYARGEIDDEEFEHRRSRLVSSR